MLVSRDALEVGMNVERMWHSGENGQSDGGSAGAD